MQIHALIGKDQEKSQQTVLQSQHAIITGHLLRERELIKRQMELENLDLIANKADMKIDDYSQLVAQYKRKQQKLERLQQLIDEQLGEDGSFSISSPHSRNQVLVVGKESDEPENRVNIAGLTTDHKHVEDYNDALDSPVVNERTNAKRHIVAIEKISRNDSQPHFFREDGANKTSLLETHEGTRRGTHANDSPIVHTTEPAKIVTFVSRSKSGGTYAPGSQVVLPDGSTKPNEACSAAQRQFKNEALKHVSSPSKQSSDVELIHQNTQLRDELSDDLQKQTSSPGTAQRTGNELMKRLMQAQTPAVVVGSSAAKLQERPAMAFGSTEMASSAFSQARRVLAQQRGRSQQLVRRSQARMAAVERMKRSSQDLGASITIKQLRGSYQMGSNEDGSRFMLGSEIISSSNRLRGPRGKSQHDVDAALIRSGYASFAGSVKPSMTHIGTQSALSPENGHGRPAAVNVEQMLQRQPHTDQTSVVGHERSVHDSNEIATEETRKKCLDSTLELGRYFGSQPLALALDIRSPVAYLDKRDNTAGGGNQLLNFSLSNKHDTQRMTTSYHKNAEEQELLALDRSALFQPSEHLASRQMSNSQLGRVKTKHSEEYLALAAQLKKQISEAAESTKKRRRHETAKSRQEPYGLSLTSNVKSIQKVPAFEPTRRSAPPCQITKEPAMAIQQRRIMASRQSNQAEMIQTGTQIAEAQEILSISMTPPLNDLEYSARDDKIKNIDIDGYLNESGNAQEASQHGAGTSSQKRHHIDVRNNVLVRKSGSQDSKIHLSPGSARSSQVQVGEQPECLSVVSDVKLVEVIEVDVNTPFKQTEPEQQARGKTPSVKEAASETKTNALAVVVDTENHHDDESSRMYIQDPVVDTAYKEGKEQREHTHSSMQQDSKIIDYVMTPDRPYEEMADLLATGDKRQSKRVTRGQSLSTLKRVRLGDKQKSDRGRLSYLKNQRTGSVKANVHVVPEVERFIYSKEPKGSVQAGEISLTNNSQSLAQIQLIMQSHALLGSAASVAAVKAASQVSQKTLHGPSEPLVQAKRVLASVGRLAENAFSDSKMEDEQPDAASRPLTHRSSTLSIILANQRLKDQGLEFSDLTPNQKNAVLFEQINILKQARSLSRQASHEITKRVTSDDIEVVKRLSDVHVDDQSPETNLASFRLCKKLKENANSSERSPTGEGSPARPKLSAKNTGVGTADIEEILNNDTTSPRAPIFPFMSSGGAATDEMATPAIGRSLIMQNSETPQDTGRLGAGGVQTEYESGASPGVELSDKLLPFEVYALTHIHQMSDAEKVALYEDQLKEAIDIQLNLEQYLAYALSERQEQDNLGRSLHDRLDAMSREKYGDRGARKPGLLGRLDFFTPRIIIKNSIGRQHKVVIVDRSNGESHDVDHAALLEATKNLICVSGEGVDIVKGCGKRSQQFARGSFINAAHWQNMNQLKLGGDWRQMLPSKSALSNKRQRPYNNDFVQSNIDNLRLGTSAERLRSQHMLVSDTVVKRRQEVQASNSRQMTAGGESASTRYDLHLPVTPQDIIQMNQIFGSFGDRANQDISVADVPASSQKQSLELYLDLTNSQHQQMTTGDSKQSIRQEIYINTHANAMSGSVASASEQMTQIISPQARSPSQTYAMPDMSQFLSGSATVSPVLAAMASGVAPFNLNATVIKPEPRRRSTAGTAQDIPSSSVVSRAPAWAPVLAASDLLPPASGHMTQMNMSRQVSRQKQMLEPTTPAQPPVPTESSAAKNETPLSGDEDGASPDGGSPSPLKPRRMSRRVSTYNLIDGIGSTREKKRTELLNEPEKSTQRLEEQNHEASFAYPGLNATQSSREELRVQPSPVGDDRTLTQPTLKAYEQCASKSKQPSLERLGRPEQSSSGLTIDNYQQRLKKRHARYLLGQITGPNPSSSSMPDYGANRSSQLRFANNVPVRESSDAQNSRSGDNRSQRIETMITNSNSQFSRSFLVRSKTKTRATALAPGDSGILDNQLLLKPFSSTNMQSRVLDPYMLKDPQQRLIPNKTRMSCQSRARGPSQEDAASAAASSERGQLLRRLPMQELRKQREKDGNVRYFREKAPRPLRIKSDGVNDMAPEVQIRSVGTSEMKRQRVSLTPAQQRPAAGGLINKISDAFKAAKSKVLPRRLPAAYVSGEFASGIPFVRMSTRSSRHNLIANLTDITVVNAEVRPRKPLVKKQATRYTFVGRLSSEASPTSVQLTGDDTTVRRGMSPADSRPYAGFGAKASLADRTPGESQERRDDSTLHDASLVLPRPEGQSDQDQSPGGRKSTRTKTKSAISARDRTVDESVKEINMQTSFGSLDGRRLQDDPKLTSGQVTFKDSTPDPEPIPFKKPILKKRDALNATGELETLLGLEMDTGCWPGLGGTSRLDMFQKYTMYESSMESKNVEEDENSQERAQRILVIDSNQQSSKASVIKVEKFTLPKPSQLSGNGYNVPNVVEELHQASSKFTKTPSRCESSLLNDAKRKIGGLRVVLSGQTRSGYPRTPISSHPLFVRDQSAESKHQDSATKHLQRLRLLQLRAKKVRDREHAAGVATMARQRSGESSSPVRSPRKHYMTQQDYMAERQDLKDAVRRRAMLANGRPPVRLASNSQKSRTEPSSVAGTRPKPSVK